jgi:hypothetical protein
VGKPVPLPQLKLNLERARCNHYVDDHANSIEMGHPPCDERLEWV